MSCSVDDKFSRGDVGRCSAYITWIVDEIPPTVVSRVRLGSFFCGWY
jgi:hypothetical protein